MSTAPTISDLAAATVLPTIPGPLVEAMKRGEAVLFLGAGASHGAEHADGRRMPMGNALRDLICDRFLNGTCRDRSLDEVASLAENSAGRAELDHFVAGAVRGFQPTSAHKLIPAFRWKAIFGTNYDMLVEAGFEVTAPLQSLRPIHRDTGIERELSSVVDPLPYYKLHGTIDYLHDRDTPLILTQESYLNFRSNRKRLFGRLEDLARELPLVFVGTRLADHHIREILQAVDADGGTRPTYFFVSPDINEYDAALLGKRRMTPIKATFQDFMAALDGAVDPLARRLQGAVAPATHSVERHFRRTVPCPDSIRAFLTDNVEHVHAGLPGTPLPAELFFKGESGSWDPIERGYDIERQIYATVMLRLLDLPDVPGEPNIICVRGVAGAGKSVFARRIAYDLAVKHDRLVLFGRPGVHLRADPLLDLHGLTGLPVTLVVDQAADQLRSVEEVASRLAAAGVPATFMLFDTHASFGSGLEPVASMIRADFELRNLNHREIRDILVKLELHRALGLLEPLGPDERIATFEKLADRQLLVALYEATHGKPLEELIVDEYHRIVLSEAQELYLLVCTLNRFSVPVRAGLIQRVMGVRFTDFEKRFLGPLAGVVFAELDPRSRDYAYRARHPHIAEIVFRRVLDTQTKQSEQYIRILEGMNPSYASDNAAMRKMLAARNLKDLSGNLAERRRILKVAERVTDGDAFILQQQAILEMNSHGGDLDYAAERLEKAIGLQPRDTSLKHTQATLLARKAQQVKDPLARRAVRNRARSVLSEIKPRSANDPYFLATKAGLAIDDLEDALKAMPKSSEAPAEQGVIRLVEDAERALEQGLSSAPEFESLTREAFRLWKLMGEREKGVKLLERTLAQQPHLEFVTATYARAVADRDLPAALAAVRRCLTEKPQSKLLNQLLFELMVREADDHRDALLGPMRRAFTSEDANVIMHVHAIRHHFMRREREEFEAAMRAAARCSVSWSELERPRLPVGGPLPDGRFPGTVAKLSGSHGFVAVPGLMQQVFIHADHVSEECWDALRQGMRIESRVFFNARGPLAREVTLEA
ncbi:SIR2 family protein [Sphingomonas lenta]|nr:SIR2 family protein [Sphingomonas lenta]